jgi:hypothetical protein
VSSGEAHTLPIALHDLAIYNAYGTLNITSPVFCWQVNTKKR